jgi:hypothetical protein
MVLIRNPINSRDGVKVARYSLKICGLGSSPSHDTKVLLKEFRNDVDYFETSITNYTIFNPNLYN